MTGSIESELFIAGIRSFLNVLMSNIEAQPDFKEKTKGKDFSLSPVIRVPDPFKEKGMSDVYMHIRLVDQRVESEVSTSPFEADVVLEGEWSTWKDILSGREELSNALAEEKLKITKGVDKLDFELISLIAGGMSNSTVPDSVFKLIEP